MALELARTDSRLGRALALGGLIATFATSVPLAANEVYREAAVLEDRVGKVRIRTAWEVPLDVLVMCPHEPGAPARMGCAASHHYVEVVRLEFVSEHRVASDGQVFRTEEPAGVVQIALAHPDSERQRIRSALLEALRALSSRAFVRPFAGWVAADDPPLDIATLGAPEWPTWICLEHGDATEVAALGDTWSHTYTDDPTGACAAMAEATASGAPEVVETLPAPERLVELVLRHVDLVRLDADGAEARIERPDGVRAIQRDARPGLMMEAVGSDDDDVFAIHEADGRRYEALAAPAEMPIEGLDRTGWIHRWTLETVERHLGREPGERVLDRTVVDVAYLATLPPEIGVGPGPAGVPFEIGETRPAPSAKPVAWDRDALVSAVVDAFSRSAVDPAGRLVAAVARPAAGLESDGWLAVVCRDGGSADYHVLPTAAANRVLNGELFCAALEARLGRGR